MLFNGRKCSRHTLLLYVICLTAIGLFSNATGVAQGVARDASSQQRAGSSGDISPLSSADRSANLDCIVVDLNGRPVFGAMVKLDAVGVPVSPVVAYTDSAGAISFSGLPHGQYVVSAMRGTAETSDRTTMNGFLQRLVLTLRDGEQLTTYSSKNAAVSAGQYVVPKQARKAFDTARASFEHGDYKGARLQLDKALTIYPSFGEALELRGITSLIEGKVDESTSDLELAVRHDPARALAHFALARIYNDRRDYDLAVRASSAGLSLAPQSWQGNFEAARAHLGRRELNSALRTIQRAEELAPKRLAPLMMVKAATFIALGDTTSAVETLRSVLQISSDGPQSESVRQLLASLER